MIDKLVEHGTILCRRTSAVQTATALKVREATETETKTTAAFSPAVSKQASERREAER